MSFHTNTRHQRARRAGLLIALSALLLALAPAGARTLPAGDHSAGAGSPTALHARGLDATARAAVPAHIATWAYDDGCNGGVGADAALVRRWVSYAESSCGPDDTKALDDCHAAGVRYCLAVEYEQPNVIYANSPLDAQSAPESWFLHQPGHHDAAHRLRTSAYGGGYYLDQANPAADAFFERYAQSHYNAYDALMVDNTAGSLQAQLYGSGFTSSQELSSAGALLGAHERLARALRHADGRPFLQIDNGIGANPYLQTPFPLLDRPASVNGLVSESVPEDDGTLINSAWAYPTMLDNMAYVDHTRDDFIVLLSYDQNGSPRSRRVQAASVLLGYSPGHTVSWSDLESSAGNLAVWPEEGVVPTRPLQSMPAPGGPGCLAGGGELCAAGGHSALQVAPGVYRREFAACYDQGVAFGRCAVIVNSTARAVTIKRAWLTLRYGHQIAFDGGDVQSGGTLDLSDTPFQAGCSVLAGADALLLDR